jgi:uncharacterized repeat protein (TIGR03803 family)
MHRFQARILTAVIFASALACSVFVIKAYAGTEQVLHTFTSGLDGKNPTAVIFDSSGNLYGATYQGGKSGSGTVYEMTPIAGGGWSKTVLYNFGPIGHEDGYQPVGALTFDAAGNLYGTTQNGGGSANCPSGCGTVFELTYSGSGWSETVLHRFSGPDGQNPTAQLIFDSAGNLYGTTQVGGAFDKGEVFELTPVAGGKWKETILHSFAAGADGAQPAHAPLAIDGAGNLYGTVVGDVLGGGAVFELSFVSGKWKKTTLHEFVSRQGIGISPYNSVTLDAAGNLYGTTYQGGVSGVEGGVFELTPGAGGTWTYSILHSFRATGGDGVLPNAGIVFDSQGNLYGTTQGGGGGVGVVYELTPSATVPWTETILYTFLGGSDGSEPDTTPLSLDAAGNIYGTTFGAGITKYGLVYEVTP